MLGNYHTPTTPQTANFRKSTIEAFFKPDDDTKAGEIPLGRITMGDLKHNSAETELLIPWQGAMQVADHQVTETKPSFELTLTEYHPNLIPMMLFGAQGADQVLPAVTAITMPFPSVNIGRSNRINRRLLTNFSLKAGAVTFLPDVDYQLFADLGIFIVMDGGAITDGSSVTAIYDAPGMTQPTYLPYSRANRLGFLRWYMVDSTNRNAREEWYVRCNLIPTDYGSSDGKKYSESKMKAVYLGTPVVRGRY